MEAFYISGAEGIGCSLGFTWNLLIDVLM